MLSNDIELIYGYCISSLEQNDKKIQKLQEQEAELQEQLIKLQEIIEYSNQAESAYRKAIDILYDNSFRDLEGKINTFLSKVFTDRYYRIFFTPETSRGSKVVNIELQSGDIISIPSDFGGSFETIIGLAFRIIYVLQTGYPILFLDETLSDVNDNYTYKVATFLKSLGSEFGVEFVIITHNEKLAPLADIHYSVFNNTYNRM